MNKIITGVASFVSVFAAGFPLLAFADMAPVSGGLDNVITLAYYVSTAGFLIATILMALAVMKFGKSTLSGIFLYFVIGTAIFLVITVFQALGAQHFGIADESMDVWWHFMFYLALASYYLGLKSLVSLGSSETGSASGMAMTSKVWGLITIVALAVIFVIPGTAEPVAVQYLASLPGGLGLHHFLAFLLAAVVGNYLFVTKKNLGQIGKAIANPMIIAMWALALQHFWELMFESWKWVNVTSEVGEGGEKIFLIITAACLIWAAWRLKSFAKG